MRPRSMAMPGVLVLAICGAALARPPFPTPKYVVGTDPRSIAVADLDGDGVTDLLAANAGGPPVHESSVSVRLGRGDGTFLAGPTFAVGTNASAIAVADLDADGVADVVVANRFSDDVSVLRGLGDGTFAPAHDLVRVPPNRPAPAPGDDGTVTICHVPPGHPGNAHTITVGAPALTAHLAHGDFVGACEGLPIVGAPGSDGPVSIAAPGRARTGTGDGRRRGRILNPR